MAGRLNNLNLLYYPLRVRIQRGLELAQVHNIPAHLFETLRTHERQAYLYAKGRTTDGLKRTNAKPGSSYHNYGLAGDIVMIVNGKWNWSQESLYHKLGPYMESVGLQWLGRSKRFPELVHFQYRDAPPVSTLKTIYDKYGLEGVWLALDQINQGGGDHGKII